MKVVCFTWTFVACLILGPGVPSPHWDLNGDNRMDLRDVQVLQNSAREVNGQVKFEVEVE